MKNLKEEIRICIKSHLAELVKIEQLSRKIAKTIHLSEDQRDNLSIAVTEAVGNAIVHGNKKDPNKNVEIVFQIQEDQIRVSVTDEGPGFELDQLADPLDPENVMKESGRGIFILQTLMDDVDFTFSSKGTTISFTLKKK
jgi:serine/threonine-protein kinase RsbW